MSAPLIDDPRRFGLSFSSFFFPFFSFSFSTFFLFLSLPSHSFFPLPRFLPLVPHVGRQQFFDSLTLLLLLYVFISLTLTSRLTLITYCDNATI